MITLSGKTMQNKSPREDNDDSNLIIDAKHSSGGINESLIAHKINKAKKL